MAAIGTAQLGLRVRHHRFQVGCFVGVADQLFAFGRRVEKRGSLGGTCHNVGCKAMLNNIIKLNKTSNGGGLMVCLSSWGVGCFLLRERFSYWR